MTSPGLQFSKRPKKSPQQVIATWAELYRRYGDHSYDGEDVSQTEHGLQAAQLAQAEGSGRTLIASALLHDIGHVYRTQQRGLTVFSDYSFRHEVLGFRKIREFLPKSVSEVVRLHVPAKRYLCAIEPDYQDRLSVASVNSLERQGGAFTEEEAAEFLDQPFAEDAIQVRRWDDQAKTPGATKTTFSDYEDLLQELVEEETGSV